VPIALNSNFFILYLIAALLAFAGGAFSIYFQLVYKEKLIPNQVWIPKICQMDSNSCTTIVDTRFGRLAGLPNALYGSVLYPVFGFILIFTGIDMIPSVLPLAIVWLRYS
jgi:uncharacterized membrane protein